MPSMPNTPDGGKFDIDRFVKRRSSLRNDFSSYQEHFAEIAENFRPRRGFYIRSQNQTGTLSGSVITGAKKHQSIINSTVIRASKNAASGLQAGVTSPSRPWKKMGSSDPDLMEIPGAREAFDELDKAADVVLSQSNFYRASQTAYADFTLFGPAALQIDSHDDEVIRCQVHPAGSWVASPNSDGKIDVFFRDYKSTGHEIQSKFETIPPELQEKINRDPYKRHELFNAIEPNPYYEGPDSPAIGLAAFPFLSVWWVKGHEREFLKVHGYYEFPVMVFRFETSELGDTYGGGPGMDALGEAKQIQHQENMKLRGLDKTIEPPLQAPTSLRQKGISLVPGHVTYHDGQNKIESLYNMNLPLAEIRADIAEAERRLSELFFEDLFLMITQGVGRQITAREVQERHEEKLIMLGPVLESIHDEFLDPALDRILGIMQRAGKWPEFPEELDGVDIKIEYTSILAQAQRAVRTVALEQGINFAANTAQFLPDILDRVDVDGVADEYFDSIGMPAKTIRSARDAEPIREQRAQQQNQERQMAMAGEAASAAKDAAGVQEQIQPNVMDQVLSRGAA